MRGFAVPTAMMPAWNRMLELRALYAVQPMRSMQQRFSSPLAWRKTSNATNNNSNSSSRRSATNQTGSTKRRLSARRSSACTGTLSAAARCSSSSSATSKLAVRAALEASSSLDEFEVLDVLGRGTFGVVKLARHIATGAAVALKVLDKRMIVAMRQETNILREQTVHLLLDHAFVSTLYATFQDPQALYFVVEYCPGGEVFSLVYDQPSASDDGHDTDDDDDDEQQQQRRSCDRHSRSASNATAAAARSNQETHDDDVLTTGTTDSESEDDRDQAKAVAAARATKLALYLDNAQAKRALKSTAFDGLAEPFAAFYLACLLVSLEYLHDMNVLYRDVKLENLVLDCDGYPKLIDFGLSKPDAADDHVRNRTMCGSMEYMAPEVLQREAYDQRADMWAFGIVMYELLLGATPFYHPNTREQGRRITSEPVTFPNNFEDAHPDACALITALLAKDPRARPQSFAHVRTSAFFTTHFATASAWQKLRTRQLRAPFVPKLDGPFDTSLFVKAASYEDESDDLYGY